MTRSLLNLYLQRVAEGDETFIEKLLGQLAERLVFVPIVDDPRQGSTAQSLKVNVVRLKEAHRSLVPVFTLEKSLKDWCARHGHADTSISLLGSDMCAALHSESWVVINPESKEMVELQPVLVKRLANIGAGEPIEPERVTPAVVARAEPQPPEEELPLPEPKKKKSFLDYLRFR